MANPLSSCFFRSVALTRPVSLPSACRCAILRREAAGLAREEDTPSARLRRAFNTLGIEQDECSVEDIRKAYIRLAKKYHPDSALQSDTEKFILVSFQSLPGSINEFSFLKLSTGPRSL